ncbi:MAG TPA: hypothetical protein VMG82_19535 [Candidatus Sulfotelmatobacter sp.]|nr:hypothetical protein [Candidatus Sulfotelmatobacter sp.]
MNRLSDEALYVLGVLHQMRDQVTANPSLFEPDALQLIDAEIARYGSLMRELKTA